MENVKIIDRYFNKIINKKAIYKSINKKVKYKGIDQVIENTIVKGIDKDFAKVINS